MHFRLKDFDGPLDLLLHLITKAKIDIHDVFVSDITDQYIDTVRHAEDLDMEEATEFLTLAAELLEIKSRAMLPKPPAVEEGEEDPAESLIRRLEEYKRYREGAAAITLLEKAAKDVFAKLPEEYPLPPQETELTGLTLDGLLEAFARMYARQKEKLQSVAQPQRTIRRDSFTVQDCMLTLVRKLKRKKTMKLSDAFSEQPTREEIVTLFLAMLELWKMGQMHIQQDQVYGDLILMLGPAREEGDFDE